MFILIFELNNIFKFNILKPIWWLLFIYIARNICSLIYHAWTPLNESTFLLELINNLKYDSN